MAILSSDELEKQLKILQAQAKLRAEISNSFDGYLGGLREATSLEKEAESLKEIQLEMVRKIRTLTGDDKTNEIAKYRILVKQRKELLSQTKILRDNLKLVNKTNLLMTKGGVAMAKAFATLPSMMKNLYADIKGAGLFEMDKSVRKTILSMGLVGDRAKDLNSTIRATSLVTNDWGMGMKELSQMQADYSDELGRAVILAQSGLESMSALAAATELGAEGAAKMSAEMDSQGLIAERTAKFIEQTMNDATSMGLNATKVVRNIQQNIKMLNRYNFKDGVKGLSKMAETVSKLGVEMEFAAGFADKLWDIEGAVDMSAQLQVMGGEWAKLSDPFQLMYKARNDMEGLTKDIAKAAASQAHFNAETGEFELSALEMHRLKVVAKETGLEYDQLATAGKNAAKFSKIKSQISFSVGGGKEGEKMQQFIENAGKLDEKGRAYIEVKGEKKFLSELGASGKSLIELQMGADKSLKDRAKEAQSFDEKLTNLINLVKTTMMPIVDGLDSTLRPLIDDLFKNNDFKTELVSLGKNIGEVVRVGASFVKSLAEMAIWLGPKGTLATLLVGWVGLKALTWYANGVQLGLGFEAVTKGGGLIKTLTSVFGGGVATLTGAIIGLGTAIAGWKLGEWLGGKATEASGRQSTEKGDNYSKWGASIGSILALGVGAALAPATGGLSLLAGASLAGGGALVGGGIGKYVGDSMNQPAHDALIPSMGSDFSKGRGIVQGGKITPIDNKDDLIAMKPQGPIAKSVEDRSQVNTVKHDFGEIKISGEVIVKTPGGGDVGVDLMRDPSFIRGMTTLINVEVRKNKNQVQ